MIITGKMSIVDRRRVTVLTDKHRYVFKESSPNSWIHVVNCSSSLKKRKRTFVFNCDGGEGLLAFFSRCIRTVEFFKEKKGELYV